MPYSDDTFDKEYDFNQSLATFNAMLYDGFGLKAEFNYSVAQGFANALSESLYMAKPVTATDLVKLLHNEIITSGTRKNSSLKAVQLLNTTPSIEASIHKYNKEEAHRAGRHADIKVCIFGASTFLIGMLSSIVCAVIGAFPLLFVTLPSFMVGMALLVSYGNGTNKKVEQKTLNALQENPSQETTQKANADFAESAKAFTDLMTPITEQSFGINEGELSIRFKTPKPL